jgi:hypothetical protein
MLMSLRRPNESWASRDLVSQSVSVTEARSATPGGGGRHGLSSRSCASRYERTSCLIRHSSSGRWSWYAAVQRLTVPGDTGLLTQRNHRRQIGTIEPWLMQINTHDGDLRYAAAAEPLPASGKNPIPHRPLPVRRGFVHPRLSYAFGARNSSGFETVWFQARLRPDWTFGPRPAAVFRQVPTPCAPPTRKGVASFLCGSLCFSQWELRRRTRS